MQDLQDMSTPQLCLCTNHCRHDHHPNIRCSPLQSRECDTASLFRCRIPHRLCNNSSPLTHLLHPGLRYHHNRAGVAGVTSDTAHHAHDHGGIIIDIIVVICRMGA